MNEEITSKIQEKVDEKMMSRIQSAAENFIGREKGADYISTSREMVVYKDPDNDCLVFCHLKHVPWDEDWPSAKQCRSLRSEYERMADGWFERAAVTGFNISDCTRFRHDAFEAKPLNNSSNAIVRYVTDCINMD